MGKTPLLPLPSLPPSVLVLNIQPHAVGEGGKTCMLFYVTAANRRGGFELQARLKMPFLQGSH